MVQTEVEMPEGDHFERSFGAGWRGVLQLVREGVGSDEEVADKLVKSLAKALRNEKGVPGIAEIFRVIAEAKVNSLLNSFNALDDIVRDHEGHRHTKVAVDVAKSRLVQKDAANGMAASEVQAHRFVEDTCSALLEHYFFARTYPQLIAEGRFSDHEDARQWQRRVEQAMQPNVVRLAEGLAQRPDAKGLRAPKRIVPTESTTNLLAVDLLSTTQKEPAGLPL